jgi:hypothetical protein
MRWTASTGHTTIGMGTNLHLMASPQIAAGPPDVLTSGDDLYVDYPAGGAKRRFTWFRPQQPRRSSKCQTVPGGA